MNCGMNYGGEASARWPTWELQARLKACLEAEQVGVRPKPPSDVAAAAAAAEVAASEAGAERQLDVSPSMTNGRNAGVTADSSTVAGAAAAAAPSSSSLPTASPATPGVASSAADKRAQYAAKLRQRTGGSITSDGRIVGPSPLSKPARAENPNVRPLDQEAMFAFQHGARDLLTYLDMRGIARILLPSPDAVTDKQAQQEAAQIVLSLQVPQFAHVISAADAVAAREGNSKQLLLDAHAALSLGATSELMLVSDEPGLLRGAKEARIFSCHYYRKLPGAARSLPSDFRAENLGDVQSAVEELCGVTFRDPDTEIRTKLGVYQT